jgi:hypothetical protein
MLLKLFKGTGPGVFLFILLSAAGVWTSAFLHQGSPSSMVYDINPMPLYALLKGLLGKSAIAGVIFTFAMLILISFLIVNFNTVMFFINERTFLPAIIYILLIGLFPQYEVLNPVLPATVLLMIAIRRMMEAYRKNETAYNFFDAALIIGAGSLFYANLIWFGLLTIIGIAILRTWNVKEIILAIIGLATPLILTSGVWYVAGKDMKQLLIIADQNLFEKSGFYYFSRVTITGLVITGLCSLVSLYFLLSVINSKKIKSRKTFTVLMWVLGIALALYFFLPSVSVEIVYIVSIPLCYIIAHYFIISRKKILPETFFTLLFITVIVLQVIYMLSYSPVR